MILKALMSVTGRVAQVEGRGRKTPLQRFQNTFCAIFNERIKRVRDANAGEGKRGGSAGEGGWGREKIGRRE